MINILTSFLVLIFVSFKLNASPFSPVEDIRVVSGVGEVVVGNEMTVGQAYEQAETLAKIDAAKKIGEYFEVLRVADSKTGDVKEIISSVNASVMQYEVVARNLTSIGYSTLAKVEIKTTVNEADLELALARYYDNQQYKNEVSQAAEKLKLLETQLLSQQVLLERIGRIERELQGGDRSILSNEVRNLRNDVIVSSLNVSQAILDFEKVKVLSSYKVADIDGQSARERALIAKPAQLSKLEEYKNMLEGARDIWRVILKNSEHFDLESDELVVTGEIKFFLNLKHSYIKTIHEYLDPHDKTDRLFNRRGFGRSSDVSKFDTYSYKLDTFYSKYALYLVVDVGGNKTRIPMIAPVINGTCSFQRGRGGRGELISGRPKVGASEDIYLCIRAGYSSDTMVGMRQNDLKFRYVFKGSEKPSVTYSFELRELY